MSNSAGELTRNDGFQRRFKIGSDETDGGVSPLGGNLIDAMLDGIDLSSREYVTAPAPNQNRPVAGNGIPLL